MSEKTKVLAYYLPAYHVVPENSEWYGEGFTEWDTTKKGVKFYPYHNQPRKPLNDNYYNLLDIRSIEWQTKIAKENGVNGFCFYHYWFNGKKMLERPAELLLENKHVDIEYCFAWANEEWRNTWHSKLNYNKVLIEQYYGDIEDWSKHFYYLLPFFKDDRYIKEGNKPVFMIYKIEDIPNYDEKFNYWNQLASKEGFDGIHLIQMINNDTGRQIKSSTVCAKVDFEPNKTVKTRESYAVSFWRIRRFLYNKLVRKNFFHKVVLDKVSYRAFYRSLMKKKYITDDFYYSMFCDWDNTPRKGKRGMIFTNATAKAFHKYFKILYEKSVRENKKYLFIFAWNEWSEGAYLEPDSKNKRAYLDAIKNVVKTD